MYKDVDFQNSAPVAPASRLDKTKSGSFLVIDGGKSNRSGAPRMHAVNPLDTSVLQLVTSDPMPFGQVISWLGTQGIDFKIVNHMKPLADCQVMLIDIESFGATDHKIDELRRLRNKHPSVLVILASWAFGHDDFSTDHLPIADVCLKAPLTFARLELALVEAEVNNEIWQVQRHHLEAMKTN